MKSVTITGTWRQEEAMKCNHLAVELGKLLAERGFSIISGGGMGTSKCVIDAYRAHGGKHFTAYFPAKKFMDRVGEKPGPKPDKVIRLKADYPERNVILVRNSQALIALNGGLGTLSEIIHAAKDYGHPAVVIDYGKLADYVRAIHDFKGKVHIAKTAKDAVDYIEKKLSE
ncbi:MAG TPA: hypothetical protein VLJ21_01250 [Candidatus Binatia bacterium]|nr:hypothetical protein [Candidatus Binatia bacterium]